MLAVIYNLFNDFLLFLPDFMRQVVEALLVLSLGMTIVAALDSFWRFIGK